MKQELCDNYPSCAGTTWQVIVQERQGAYVHFYCNDCAEPMRLTAYRWEPKWR